jgi:signal transduction histidine kinase
VSATDAVEIVVEDDGPGIAEEDLPRVFDRFFTKRASGRGMGLGLALVRAIAQAHAGRVDVRSIRGRGTAFTMRLPLDRG